MITNTMTVALTLIAFDKMSRVINGAVNKSSDEFDRLQRKINKTSEAMEKIGKSVAVTGAALTTAGIGLGAALGLGDTIPQAIESEKKLREIGNVGDLSKMQIAGLNKELGNISKITNQTRPELLEAINFYTAQGITNMDKLAKMTEVAAKVATAENADITQVGIAAYRVTDNLKVPVDKLNKVMDILAQSGKEGSFELKNMAEHFPQLTASAMSLGMKGVPAVAQLGASLQIAQKGAADAGTAANNFANFLQKIRMPDTFKELEKFELPADKIQKMLKQGKEIPPQIHGINEAWENALKSKDPIFEIMKILKMLEAQGVKTTEVFQDRQVLDFVNIMLPNLKEYERIKQKSLAASGVIDKDFQNMMGVTANQWKNLKINKAEMVMPNLVKPLEAANKLLTKINQNPVLQKGLFGLIVGLTGGGLLLTAIGGVSLAVGKITSGYGKFLKLAKDLTPVLMRNGRELLVQNGLMSTVGNFETLKSLRAAGNPLGIDLSKFSISSGLLADFKRASSKVSASMNKGILGTNIKDVFPKIGDGVIKGFEKLKTTTIGWDSANNVSLKNLLKMSKTLSGNLVNGIWSAIKGFALFNLTLLTSPITWIAVAIGGAALLIYKYWKPITAFFKGVWKGINQAIEPVSPEIAKIGKALAPIVAPLKLIFSWFKNLLKPVDDVGGKSEAMGVKIGKAIGGAIVKVTQFISKIVSLRGWVSKAGATMAKAFHIGGGKETKGVPVAQSAGTLPKFDVGSRFITQTGLSIVHRGEEIAPAGTVKSIVQTQKRSPVSISAPFSPNITISNGNPQEIEKTVKKLFDEYQRHLEAQQRRAVARAY